MKHISAYNIILFLFGSWFSVVIHVIFFFFLLYIWKDMLLFTLIVSIEAIYIGIFILMAQDREEKAKEKSATQLRYKDRQLVKEDVTLTMNVKSDISNLKKDMLGLQTDINETRKHILDLKATLKAPTTPKRG